MACWFVTPITIIGGGRGPSLPRCRRHNSVGVVRNNADADRAMLDAQSGGDRLFTPDARCRRRAEGIRGDQKGGHAGRCMQKVHCGLPAGVAVTVSARLHLGFLDLNGEFGRQFGSLGLSISEPRGRLTLRRASAARVDGVERERASRYLSKMQQREGLAGGCHLTIDEAIPPHAGLGSGTQLALGVAAALRRLHGRALDMPGDARLLRSRRALGRRHRLVRDGRIRRRWRARADERRAADRQPDAIFPRLGGSSSSSNRPAKAFRGRTERGAFGRLRSDGIGGGGGDLPSRADGGAAFDRGRRHRRIWGGDHAESSGCWATISRRRRAAVGSPVPMSPAVLDCLAEQGAHGVGQSSWGPTGFAFASDANSAERLADAARRCASARALDIRVVSALNHGAEITDLDPPDA